MPTPVAVSVIGSCETTVEHAEWAVRWVEFDIDGNDGEVLETGTLKATFDMDWGYGVVAGGRDTRVRLYGTMDIAVTRRGPVSFKIAGDDGYRLRITGDDLESKLIIDNWDTGSYREEQEVISLEAGIYRLNLEYFELLGSARLTFAASPDVIGWFSIGDCTEEVNVAPSGVFTLLETDEPLRDVAARFEVDVADLRIADYPDAPDWVLVPGPPTPTRKVIVIQGIDSAANWKIDSTSDEAGSLLSRVKAIVAVIQTNAWEINTNQSTTDDWIPIIDPDDVITFSYSGKYTNTDAVTENSVGVEEHSGTSNYYADYEAADTCTGVAAGASKLGDLVRGLVSQNPDVRIDLVAHSMGGLVSAYWLATESDAGLTARIHSLTTLDSPLGGVVISSPLSSCNVQEADGSRPLSPSWADLLGRTDIVPTIRALDTSDFVTEFRFIQGSSVGQALPGEPLVVVNCAAGAVSGAASLGFLLFGPFGLLLGGVADVTVGHTCVWADALALQTMASAINLPVSR